MAVSADLLSLLEMHIIVARLRQAVKKKNSNSSGLWVSRILNAAICFTTPFNEQEGAPTYFLKLSNSNVSHMDRDISVFSNISYSVLVLTLHGQVNQKF